MAKLQNKVQNALDEGRILILGIQVLIGVQLRISFEPGFDKLSKLEQQLGVTALGVLIIGFVLLVWPATYHRIVENGNDSQSLHTFTTWVMGIAVLPFAIGIGLDLYLVVRTLVGTAIAIALAVLSGMVALFCWYGLEVIHKKAGKDSDSILRNKTPSPMREKTDLEHRIRQVLTETRMVLPGAQALLGFQFITMLMQNFDSLPTPAKYVHLFCLLSTTLSTILLMTPAAYHRVVLQGEETEFFHTFASRILLMAMIPLAWSLCGDFFVVFWKISDAFKLSLAVSLFMLVCFYSLWFGYTYYKRRHLPVSGKD